jgi:hypothetical protein
VKQDPSQASLIQSAGDQSVSDFAHFQMLEYLLICNEICRDETHI